MSAATTTTSTRAIADLPAPKQTWFFGNALQLDLPKMHLQLEAWARELGPIYQLSILGRPVVVVSDPELGEAVLRARPEGFRRVSTVQRVFEEMGLTGVFSAEGAEWRSQRRLAMEALATRHLRGFYPKLQMIMERLVKRWEKAADEQRVLDLATELKLVTVDVTTLLVFGHDIDTLGKADGDADIIQGHLEVFFPAFHRRMNALVPYWRYVRLPRDRKLDRAIIDIGVWIAKRIDAARARLAEDPSRAEKPENFMESMLVARDEQGKPFSENVIQGNALQMLLAGEDTTAHSIGWAMHHLCDEPGVLAKLREELARSLGSLAVPATLEAANGLAYAGGVANEAMRLRSVAPFNFTESLQDTVVGDVAIPRGSSVVVLSRLPTLDDKNFANPAAFDPERWIPALHTGAHDASTFTPFGSGPRLCPGRALAILEMKMALAAIYQRFDVERVGASNEVKETAAFTVMVDGLRVRVKRRSATPTA